MGGFEPASERAGGGDEGPGAEVSGMVFEAVWDAVLDAVWGAALGLFFGAMAV